MPATRSDIHSPSNFDPAEYTYITSFDAEAGDPGARGARQAEMYELFGVTVTAYSPVGANKAAAKKLLRENGFAGGNFAEKGTCDHCGASTRYFTVWHHVGGEHIAVGYICAEERFELPDRVAYDIKRLKAAAKAERERIATLEKAMTFLASVESKLARALLLDDEAFEAIVASATRFSENPDLVKAARQHNVISDIRAKLYQWGSLSDRQVAHVERVYGWVKRDAEAAQRPVEANVTAPEGKVTFEGVVVGTKWQATAYGDQKKLVIKVTEADGVWLVYVSEPSAISANKGDIVRMTAKLNDASQRRDAYFAFGNLKGIRNAAAIIGSTNVVEDEDLPSALD